MPCRSQPLLDPSGPPTQKSRTHPGDTPSKRCASGDPTALNEGRDLNPGDTLYAIENDFGRFSSLNEGRDLNPGDTGRGVRLTCARSTLNEGRDLNPGDTGEV